MMCFNTIFGDTPSSVYGIYVVLHVVDRQAYVDVMPRLGGSTRGNRRVPWVDLSFSKPNQRLARHLVNKPVWKTKTQPDLSRLLNFKKYSNSRNSIKISTEFCLKNNLPPAKEKTISIKNIKFHNPIRGYQLQTLRWYRVKKIKHLTSKGRPTK